MSESVQYWTPEWPCYICGADSNTSHFPACINAGLYDEDGVPIPAVPAGERP
jgi:hypothetical protein